MAKQTVVFYSEYLDEVKNILVSIDKESFNTHDRDKLIEKIDEVFMAIGDYWIYGKEEVKDSSEKKTSKRKSYYTQEEAEGALKRQKKKKGSVLVRHRSDGRWEVVNKKNL